MNGLTRMTRQHRRPLGRHLAWAATALLLLALYGVSAIRAQDGNAAPAAEPVPAPATAPQEEQQSATIMGMIFDSGPLGWAFMGVLAVFSIVAAAIALERLVNLTRAKVIPPQFLQGLNQLLARGEDQIDAYRQLCRQSRSPIARVLNAGLLRCGRPLPEVEKSMEDAVAREMASLRGRVRPLSVIGSVAPLVGLLGTVVGMIIAFFNASQAGLGKAELLAEGIYLALLTTAAGLSVAIPCVLLAAMFNSRVERYMLEIDEQLMETMPFLARMENALPPASGVAASAEASPQPALAASHPK